MKTLSMEISKFPSPQLCETREKFPRPIKSITTRRKKKPANGQSKKKNHLSKWICIDPTIIGLVFLRKFDFPDRIKARRFNLPRVVAQASDIYFSFSFSFPAVCVQPNKSLTRVIECTCDDRTAPNWLRSVQTRFAKSYFKHYTDARRPVIFASKIKGETR